MESMGHLVSHERIVTSKIRAYALIAFSLSSLVLVVLLSLLGAGCERRSSGTGEMEAAELDLLAGYTNDDPIIAFAALTNYHLRVLSSSGFNGRLELPRVLLSTEARLFVLARHLGKSNEASSWFETYSSNLNVLRARDTKGRLAPLEADVIGMVEKIDAQHLVHWKAKGMGGISNSSTNATRVAPIE